MRALAGKYGVHRRLVREALMLMSELTRLLGEFLLDCQLARGRSSGKGIKLPLRRLARGRLGVHRAAAIIPFGDAHEVYWDQGSAGAGSVGKGVSAPAAQLSHI